MTKTTNARCAQGVLKGVLDHGAHTFFDIPYADDAGRFLAPLPPSGWDGSGTPLNLDRSFRSRQAAWTL